MKPTLELTFHDVAGSPWQGTATIRFQGEPSERFAVREGMTGKQREAVRWYVEEYMDYPEGGNETRARLIERALRDYGKSLWEGLESPDLHAWLGAVRTAGAGRLELRAGKQLDEIAFRTPWELMRVGGGKLLHQLGVTVVRRVRADLPRLQVADTSQGLRILTVVCRPDETGFLDPRYTPEAILTALAERPEVAVDFCRPATLGALVDQLQRAKDEEKPYHVVHFDGHGTTIPQEAGIGALCFEQDDGSLDLVRATRFGDLMARFDVPLVVLEACRTATKAFAQETVAAALLRQGVGTVVAMGHAVHVDMTRELMGSFYEAIARGRTLGEALQQARNRVYAMPRRRVGVGPDASSVDLHDWFVPQLYQGGENPILLARKTARRKPRPEPIFAGFHDPPRAGFQGRGRELHRLERAVFRERAVVLHAPGGMGKTALAREAARWWTRTGWFADGALFVSFEGRPAPEAVVSRLGEAIEGLDFHQRKDPRAWLDEHFNGRRMLIVWDNYESVLPAFQGGRPTPPAFAEMARRWSAEASRLLVTCRDAEAGLDAWPVALGELSEPEGLFLLVRMLERLGIDREERAARGWTSEALAPVVGKTGGHPLALELLAPQIAALGPKAVVKTLGELLAKAEQEHGEDRNRSMEASLDFSIRHLSEKARAALPSVALLAGGCLESMASLVAGLEEAAWSEVRQELERTGLVRIGGGAFRPHPVLADVAGIAPTREQEKRFFAVVLGLCQEFNKLVHSADPKPALEALGITEAVVRRAIDRAVAAGKLDLAWAMADSLKRFLERSGRSGEGATLMTELHRHVGAEGEELTEIAATLEMESAWARAATDADGAAQTIESLLSRLNAVRSWDTRFQQANAFMILGRIHCSFRQRPNDALAPLKEAEKRFEELEEAGQIDSTNRAATLGSLANALRHLNRFDEALAAAEKGCDLDRKRNDASAAARGLGRIAQILFAAGRHQEGAARTKEAIEAAEGAGDNEELGILWQQLGAIATERNRPEEAVAHLRKALAAFQKGGNDRGRMQVLNLFGCVENQRGNLEAASAWYERSLQLAEILGDLEGQATARSNRAIILNRQADDANDPDSARRLLHQAIAEEREAIVLKEQLGHPSSIAISHSNLADSLRRVGLFEEAEEHAQKALAIFEPIGHAGTWKTLGILENIAEARGDATAAADYRRRKEAARAAAQERAGAPSLPREAVMSLLQLSVSVRGRGLPLDQVLSSAGAGDDFLAQLDTMAPWLAAHLRALAAGEPRPSVEVPQSFLELVNGAWEAASS